MDTLWRTIKTYTDIKIKNETTVTTTKADNQGTWDVEACNLTTYVTWIFLYHLSKTRQSGQRMTELGVIVDGEKHQEAYNCVTDVTNQWLIFSTGNPGHMLAELIFHYKLYYHRCSRFRSSYDVKEITIKAGDKRL